MDARVTRVYRAVVSRQRRLAFADHSAEKKSL